MSVWKSDETLLSICILNFSFKNDFVWEEISNIRHSVSSPDETPRSSSKILRCASYFQLSSRCFIWWWNTASHVWYITWKHLSHICLARCLNNWTQLMLIPQPESAKPANGPSHWNVTDIPSSSVSCFLLSYISDRVYKWSVGQWVPMKTGKNI